jgi:hypothetical protein
MKWQEKGPRALKHRAAEDDVGRASVVDLGAKISSIGKLRVRFWTPPLRLKVERQGGSGIAFIVVDPGTLIETFEEVRPRFRTPPPPPAPPGLTVERQGGSGITPAPLIRAPRSMPSRLDFRLTIGAFAPKLRKNGFLALSFPFLPP